MRPVSACDVAHVPVDESEVLPGMTEDSVVPQEDGVYVFPASLEQIRYWTLDQLDGASTASNMAIAARLEGLVEDALVERAIHAIVERHEALRTTFRLVDGQLCQVISEEARYSFTVTDLRTLPEAERAAAGEAAVEEHSHARADLAKGPAFFVRLIHLSETLHFLAFTMHHIVCDGWSNGILIRDFTDFYAAFAQQREPELPELPFQFADFTVWQQNWLESDAARAAVGYWRGHIHRGMPAVDLPTDRPRLPQKSYPGHIESSLLTPALTARLKNYCRTQNATMHQVFLAAFEALIARYANQNEFLLGSTIANRTQPGMENVVGRFANPQVILADVTGDPSYRELLSRVVAWSTESYAHQDLPFSRLMEEFQLDQAGATSQFLQVYFVYQKAFMQPQEAEGLKVVPRPSVSGGVNFDLLVSIVERAEGPRLQMEYNTVLFRKERIVRLITMYLRVLEAVMENDGLTVSQLPLTVDAGPGTTLAAAEEAVGFASLGAQSQAQVQGKAGVQGSLPSLAESLDRQAALLGDAPAILAGSERLSWKSLLQRSQGMAASMRALGVTAGQTVALRLESGTNDAAAALAVLRMGAVALPIPATTGAQEWTKLLSSLSPALALASADFAATVPGLISYQQLVSADKLDGAESFPELEYPDSGGTAWLALHSTDHGALSTVACSHQTTLRNLQAAAVSLDLRSGDAVLVTPADSATDAWTDLLLPLVAGATLFYPEKRQTGAGQASAGQAGSWQAALDQQQVSFALVTPAALLKAQQERWMGDRRLNVVVRGGLLTNALAKRFSVTPFRLWSLLSSPLTAGPLAIGKPLPSADAAQEALVGFGPLAGQRLLIVDDKGQAVPAGVSGELAVATETVVVRTGYLARFNPDQTTSLNTGAGPAGVGGFEIVDRVSNLVRLHGYRFRLGELEDLLWQHSSVAETYAALLPVNGVSTLVAYVRTFESGHEPGVESGFNAGADAARSIRQQFQENAPGHVAGAELIQVGGLVSTIPRRADGSVDLSILPAPGTSKSADTVAEEYVGPRDDLEKNLVGIWEEVLGVRPIGIRSSFFKLGGYSLMIVRLFARINKALGTALPITTIFNAPTVEQLADIVRGRAYYSSLVPVQTGGTKPPFFMIHSYLLYHGIPRVLGEDYPFYGLRELDTDAEDMTVEQRAAAYLDAMRSIQPTGPYYIGGWCAAGPLAVETARQILVSGEKVGFLVLFDSWRPGYSAELAKEQAGSKEMSLSARMGRKFLFHRNRWRNLSASGRVNYVFSALTNKLTSMRSRFYLKHWAKAEWLCKRFGLSLPHFMHNVSLTTLNSLKEYKGVEPYEGAMMLIRAEEAPYFPGAQKECGWETIVKGGVQVAWAPGDHESMFLDPNLQKVGDLLRKGLAEAYSEQS